MGLCFPIWIPFYWCPQYKLWHTVHILWQCHFNYPGLQYSPFPGDTISAMDTILFMSPIRTLVFQFISSVSVMVTIQVYNIVLSRVIEFPVIDSNLFMSSLRTLVKSLIPLTLSLQWSTCTMIRDNWFLLYLRFYNFLFPNTIKLKIKYTDTN